MGYGSRALELLARYYQGEFASLSGSSSSSAAAESSKKKKGKHSAESKEESEEHESNGAGASSSSSSLQTEKIQVRKGLAPLLQVISFSHNVSMFD